MIGVRVSGLALTAKPRAGQARCLRWVVATIRLDRPDSGGWCPPFRSGLSGFDLGSFFHGKPRSRQRQRSRTIRLLRLASNITCRVIGGSTCWSGRTLNGEWRMQWRRASCFGLEASLRPHERLRKPIPDPFFIGMLRPLPSALDSSQQAKPACRNTPSPRRGLRRVKGQNSAVWYGHGSAVLEGPDGPRAPTLPRSVHVREPVRR